MSWLSGATVELPMKLPSPGVVGGDRVVARRQCEDVQRGLSVGDGARADPGAVVKNVTMPVSPDPVVGKTVAVRVTG